MNTKLNPKQIDKSGSGRWDRNTLRYIPISGGSRSALPLEGESKIPRYRGWIKPDERHWEQLPLLQEYFSFLGGGFFISEGNNNEYVK